MNKTHLTIILILFNPVIVLCQEETISEVITSVAEELVYDESDAGDGEIYSELLDELADNPVQINSADVSEISRLVFLSGFQVKSLADYVSATGPVHSVYELATIPGFDREIASQVFPFITFAVAPSANAQREGWKSTLLTNYSKKLDADVVTYQGPSWKMLSKFKFSTRNISGGFTIEKDAGERFLTGTPPLPDFLSVNLAYTGTGFIRKIIIGDFSARFGQGTNINTGFRTSLSLNNPGFILARDEIRQYTSGGENSFFRGIAAEAALNKIALIMYVSRNRLDATTGSATGSDPEFIESFYEGGLHNTELLLARKDAVTEKSYGLNLSCNLRETKTGFTWSQVRFSLPIRPEAKEPYEVLNAEGQIFNSYSVYYNHVFRRMHFSGEFSLDDNLKPAFVQTFSTRPSDRLLINILYRNYSPGYFSFHANGPGSSSSTSNARGLYGGFRLEIARYLYLSAGTDIEYYPWLRYRCSSPSWGTRQEARLRYMPSASLTLEGMYSYRQSMINKTGDSGIPAITETSYSTIRGVIVYSPSATLTLRSRADYKIVRPSGSRGTLLLQDIICRFREVPLSFWFRFCIFNTDGWDPRLYTYENDLLYSYSIPALYGKGSRNYLMIKCEIGDLADLRVRYGITTKAENRDVTTSAEEIKVQVIIRF